MDNAIRKVKGNIDRLFDKNLNDLVRGIRKNKENEAKYITSCIDEIKEELKVYDLNAKQNAVLKLAYLQMLGYDICWAGFHIIEVMSSSRFTYKRIGYLAASLSFHSSTEVLMLTTNTVRKDLSSMNQYESATALTSLSCFISTDLARDLVADVLILVTSTKPYLRKRAIILLYRIFLRYPEALRPSFLRLKERLNDTDSGVQCAAVNVICELARKNPQNYISLAPVFFKLMSSSTNNWMLIKIIKLLGALTPFEPRLGKKLIEPLTNLIHSTSAMSLLYECINTVIAVLISISSGLHAHEASIQLCVQKLRVLIEDSDQNLKYLGLLALARILHAYPRCVQPHTRLVIQCLEGRDESIRVRALDLLDGMVTRHNLMEIVKRLSVLLENAARGRFGAHSVSSTSAATSITSPSPSSHSLSAPLFSDQLIEKIISLCSRNNYVLITNFEWYVSVLIELTRVHSSRNSRLVSQQLIDIAVRVDAVRSFLVTQMSLLLKHAEFCAADYKLQTNILFESYQAATWICGEFGSLLSDFPATITSIIYVIELLSRSEFHFAHIISVCMHNAMKLYIHMRTFSYHGNKTNDADAIRDESLTSEVVNEGDDDVKAISLERVEVSRNFETEEVSEQFHEIHDTLYRCVEAFCVSSNLEIQERATSTLQMLKIIARFDREHQMSEVRSELHTLYACQLNPVASKAQRKVPLPAGLNLDKVINKDFDKVDCEDTSSLLFSLDKCAFSFDVDIPDEKLFVTGTCGDGVHDQFSNSQNKLSLADPHYLRACSTPVNTDVSANGAVDVSDSIVAVSLSQPLKIQGLPNSDSFLIEHRKKMANLRKQKSSRKHFQSDVDDVCDSPQVCVVAESTLPEDAQLSSDEETVTQLHTSTLLPDDPHRALNIDLDKPVSADDLLSVSAHRHSSPFSAATAAVTNAVRSRDNVSACTHTTQLGQCVTDEGLNTTNKKLSRLGQSSRRDKIASKMHKRKSNLSILGISYTRIKQRDKNLHLEYRVDGVDGVSCQSHCCRLRVHNRNKQRLLLFFTCCFSSLSSSYSSVQNTQESLKNIASGKSQEIILYLNFVSSSTNVQRVSLDITYSYRDTDTVTSSSVELVFGVLSLLQPTQSHSIQTTDQLHQQMSLQSARCSRVLALPSGGKSQPDVYDAIVRTLTSQMALREIARVHNTCSLYGCTSTCDGSVIHLCVLLKLLEEGSLGLDLKSSNQSFVEQATEELCQCIQLL